MTPREAATATGIDRLTILKWIRSGRLPAERVVTPHGLGYEIRPEDLTQAIQQPRKRREGKPHAPASGSIVAQMAELTAAVDRLQGEVHDLRGQLYQSESRLQDALKKVSGFQEMRTMLYQTERRLTDSIARVGEPVEGRSRIGGLFKRREESR